MKENFKTFHFKIDEREVSIKLKENSPGYLEIPIVRPTNPYEAGYSGSLKEKSFLNDIESLVPKSIKVKISVRNLITAYSIPSWNTQKSMVGCYQMMGVHI